ncbi:MAG: secretin N-terminal domain-containing protein [Planctomycetota bacterium]
MMAKRFFPFWGQAKAFIFVFAVIVVFGGSFLFAAEQASDSGLKRYRVFSLRHISVEQGKDYLAQANIGTVSQLPGANALLVTAEPADLIKASAILGLIDAEEQFLIKAIVSASEVENLPSNEQIAAEVGDISIGTFSDPPTRDASIKAVIDMHEDTVIAVAPVGQLERIISAIERLQTGEKAIEGGESAPEPSEATKSDEFIDKLLNSLAEAEKIEAELAAQKPSESAAEQPPEPNLPSVIQRVEAEDTAGEAKPQLQPEVKPAAVEMEQPDETAELVRRVRPYEPQPLPIGEEMLELDLPEKLNIIDLLDLVGKYLHLDYMYDEKVLLGKEVSLRLQGPIKVGDLYPLLESVLKFRGFVMTRKGNLITIVPTEEALNIDPALHPERGDIKFGDVIITRIFSLKHISTTSAANLLTGMKLSVNVTPIAETGTVIVTGYAYRMARIEEVLKMIDKPGAPKQFRFRQLKYTMAQTLAPKVKTLVEQLGTVSVTIAQAAGPEPPGRPPRRGSPPRRPAPAEAEPTRPGVYLDADERTNRIMMIGFENELNIVESLIDTLDVEQQDLRFLRLYEIQNVGADEVVKKLQELGIVGGGRGPTTRITAGTKPAKPQTAKPAAAGAGQEALVEEPQVVIIESTNSLLVNATPEQHTQVAMIIGYVDSETLEEAIPYEIYALENQDPEELANVLNQLIKETIKDKEGKIEKVISKQEEEIIIIPDKNTFSLIVYATKKNQEWIRKLINNLDKRRPQVLIDVTLVEISKSDAFAYDLELVQSFPNLENTSEILGGIGGTTTAEILDKLLGTIVGPNETPPDRWIPERRRYIDFSSRGGTGGGFYGDSHIQALLTAMQTKDYGRVLAKPKILVNDNEPGTIKTTDTTYVKKVGSVIVPDGGSQQTVEYQSYDAGVTLNITPHISEGDLLRLEIVMSRSDFLPSDPELPPDTTSSDIDTVVTVPDGSTIILGGLLKLNQVKGGSKIPILGDIPLVGGLFRDTNNSDIQRKLYVFVKAEIIRPEDTAFAMGDLERISNRNRAAFEEIEDEFQKYHDWPGIKPKPMDPLRVLEAE